jgi:hypothetical protein
VRTAEGIPAPPAKAKPQSKTKVARSVAAGKRSVRKRAS